MSKVVLWAASGTVLGLAGMVWATLAAEGERVPLPAQRPMPASFADARTTKVAPADAALANEPARHSPAVPTEAVRLRATGPASPALPDTPTARPTAPLRQEAPVAPPALAPSPGSQVSKEVFAEDVVARRAAYGRVARTPPEHEESGN